MQKETHARTACERHGRENVPLVARTKPKLSDVKEFGNDFHSVLNTRAPNGLIFK